MVGACVALSLSDMAGVESWMVGLVAVSRMATRSWSAREVVRLESACGAGSSAMERASAVARCWSETR